jgi:hypothetical protein
MEWDALALDPNLIVVKVWTLGADWEVERMHVEHFGTCGTIVSVKLTYTRCPFTPLPRQVQALTSEPPIVPEAMDLDFDFATTGDQAVHAGVLYEDDEDPHLKADNDEPEDRDIGEWD